MTDWDGNDRRAGRASRRSGDICPRQNECPVVLERLREDMDSVRDQVAEINGHVKSVDADVQPIKTFWTATHNRFAASIAAAVLSFVAGVVWTQQSVIARLGERQDVVWSRLEAHEQRFAEGEKVTNEWRERIVVKLDELLRRSHAHDERGRVISGSSQ